MCLNNRRKHTWCASYSIWISCVARLTGANASMISGGTVSKPCTFTRIHALLILTSQCCWTFWISQALILLASDVRIRVRSIPSRTGADSPVVLCWANCVHSASFQWTWVNTFTIDAGLSQWALYITLASS